MVCADTHLVIIRHNCPLQLRCVNPCYKVFHSPSKPRIEVGQRMTKEDDYSPSNEIRRVGDRVRPYTYMTLFNKFNTLKRTVYY